jgi:hypothetical protein
MVCLRLADIECEYEVAMRAMEESPSLLTDSTLLTDLLLRVIAARKALIEHRQTCVVCKTTAELKNLV